MLGWMLLSVATGVIIGVIVDGRKGGGCVDNFHRNVRGKCSYHGGVSSSDEDVVWCNDGMPSPS